MSDIDSPMMKQYSKMREKAGDAVLFFRLGDFYEMFDSDAVEVSGLLSLTLTQRHGRPMCGIPHHASRAYVSRLLRFGKKIAICEQVGEIGKGLVDRDIVEVISPGTALDEAYLDEARNSYLLSFAVVRGRVCVAYADASTGEFYAFDADEARAIEVARRELARLSPRELLVQQSLLEMKDLAEAVQDTSEMVVNRFPDWSFDIEQGRRDLLDRFGTATLKGFGFEDDEPSLAAAGALIRYMRENLKVDPRQFASIAKPSESGALSLDEATQRNLELFKNTQDGGKERTLLSILDATKTSMGARRLRRWMAHPLANPPAIEERLDGVQSLYDDQSGLSRDRVLLARTPDLERLIARVAMRRSTPKDAFGVMAALEAFDTLYSGRNAVPSLPPIAPEVVAEVVGLGGALKEALDEAAGSSESVEGAIKPGYDAELDRLRALRDGSNDIVERYVSDEREATGMSSLKLRYNRLIGYFMECSKPHAEKAPAYFIRRQSMANCERFTTQRLADLEVSISESEGAVSALERRLFDDVVAKVDAASPALKIVADWLAALDALASLAHCAALRGYSRPVLDDSMDLEIDEGRHPVVEAFLREGRFVPNSLSLRGNGVFFHLITGPNMAGKSTYLRQTALIVLMAQMGSFVPAESARIGAVDRVFCRVGAQDNLARGESTFLVEMHETAQILRTATGRSLVIMDEVGRGTSTVDGLSIAQAVCEFLLDEVCARTLFATHYLELSAIDRPGFANRSMLVEDEGAIVFTRKVVEGAAAGSYGIHVARMAGVPPGVCDRADSLKAHYEGLSGMSARPMKPQPAERAKRHAQRDLFQPEDIVISAIESIPIDSITPLEALNALAALKKSISNRDSRP